MPPGRDLRHPEAQFALAKRPTSFDFTFIQPITKQALLEW